MRGFNKIFVMGNLGTDPEMKQWGSGGTVRVHFSLAVNERWKGSNGEDQEHVSWFNVVVFGKLADIAAKYLRKGSQVHVEGKMRQKKYLNKAGQVAYIWELLADGFNMLGQPRQVPQGAERVTAPAGHLPPDYLANAVAGADEDIPF